MNSNVNLINAGKYLNRICADMSVSKLYYYNIQYTLSTTILEYQLKYNLTSKDMASYLEVSSSMLPIMKVVIMIFLFLKFVIYVKN